jgi:hypothetical protein
MKENPRCSGFGQLAQGIAFLGVGWICGVMHRRDGARAAAVNPATLYNACHVPLSAEK